MFTATICGFFRNGERLRGERGGEEHCCAAVKTSSADAAVPAAFGDARPVSQRRGRPGKQGQKNRVRVGGGGIGGYR